jgi:hypothetical protein
MFDAVGFTNGRLRHSPDDGVVVQTTSDGKALQRSTSSPRVFPTEKLRSFLFLK